MDAVCSPSSCISSSRVAERSFVPGRPGRRVLTLEGQQFVAGDRSRKLYPVHFCRDCGQEYYPVWYEQQAGVDTLTPRDIDERQHEDKEVSFGFFMPDTTGIWDDRIEEYPESWLEPRPNGDLKIKSALKNFSPSPSP